MIGKTYSIVRSSRIQGKTEEEILETGLEWEEADSRREHRAEEDRAAHPLQSSWSRDVFIVRMER